VKVASDQVAILGRVDGGGNRPRTGMERSIVGLTVKAALIALAILLPLAWLIARHWGFSQKTTLKSSDVHAKIPWWKEIGITSEQKRRLDELDKVYRKQARKYLILWKQKLQELYEIDLISSDQERILKLAKEVGDAYSKFEMIQAMRRSALLKS